MSVTWTPATESILRDLAAKGWSGAQIATKLNVTRNAVIGKCRRLGVRLRGDESTAQHRQRALKSAATAREKAREGHRLYWAKKRAGLLP